MFRKYQCRQTLAFRRTRVPLRPGVWRPVAQQPGQAETHKNQQAAHTEHQLDIAWRHGFPRGLMATAPLRRRRRELPDHLPGPLCLPLVWLRRSGFHGILGQKEDGEAGHLSMAGHTAHIFQRPFERECNRRGRVKDVELRVKQTRLARSLQGAARREGRPA
jgi:hypothetical protein